MTRDELAELVVGAVRTRFNLQTRDVGLGDDLFTTLGGDSMQLMEVIADIEKATGIEVDDVTLDDFTQPGDIVDYLAARLS